MNKYKPGTLLRYRELSGYFEIFIVLSYYTKNSQKFVSVYYIDSFSNSNSSRILHEDLSVFLSDEHEVLHEL
jgi:hypothetical protein